MCQFFFSTNPSEGLTRSQECTSPTTFNNFLGVSGDIWLTLQMKEWPHTQAEVKTVLPFHLWWWVISGESKLQGQCNTSALQYILYLLWLNNKDMSFNLPIYSRAEVFSCFNFNLSASTYGKPFRWYILPLLLCKLAPAVISRVFLSVRQVNVMWQCEG